MTRTAASLVLLETPALVRLGGGQAGLLMARRGDRCFVQVRRGAGDNVLRWLPAEHVEKVAHLDSARADQQTLRPDPGRTLSVGQHTGRQPRAAR